DEAEGDAVHIHLVASPLLREGLRHPDDPRFRRRIVGLAGIAAEADDRRDVHDLAEDLAPFGCLLLRKPPNRLARRAQDPEWRNEVYVQDGLKLLVRHLLDDR